MKEDEVLVLQKGFGGWIEREKKTRLVSLEK
jgi:hypothetical protein